MEIICRDVLEEYLEKRVKLKMLLKMQQGVELFQQIKKFILWVIKNIYINNLASFQNIKIARDAICSLILGSPPGKVYSNLRYISKRNSEKF